MRRGGATHLSPWRIPQGVRLESGDSVSGPEAEQLVADALDVEVSESLKERAMDEAPVGITISDPSLPDNPMVYANDAFERLTGYTREECLGRNCRFLQGENTGEEPVATLAAAIDDGERVRVQLRNYRKDGTEFWNRVDVAPIYEDGTVTHFVGFQTDVTRRVLAEQAARERARGLREERRALERVLDRVETLLARTADVLVQSTTRAELQQRVCETVSCVEPYALAWIGEYDPATGDVDPAVAATDSTEIGGFELELADDDPVLRALTSDEVVVADAGADGLHGEGWPDRYRSVAAVPLGYRESTYGVLAVYATETGTFDDSERAILEAVGRAVATGLNAIQSHRRAVADERAELEFDLTGTDLLPVALAAELDCEFAYVGAERTSPDAMTLLFDVTGADPEAVERAIDGTSASVVAGHGSSALVEFVDPDPSLVASLAERGVTVESLAATPDDARLVVTAPAGDDGRGVVETVEEVCRSAELTAFRQTTETGDGDPVSVGERLTDRQRAVLRRAYAGGFFDTPRRVSGKELAASMDLAPSTFHQHLRAALRKVAGDVTDGDGAPADRT
jgi:PAS domain S-box-containing protein